MVETWAILWPLICLAILVYSIHATAKSNRERTGWAETPWHPSFNIIMKNGKPRLALQMEGHQFLFESEEDLEKLLRDGHRQQQRAKSMAVLMSDQEMKSAIEQELDSL